MELYTPCEGFDSARAGIIFGVGLKTNYDFRLTEVLALLGRYWEDLASAFINDNNKFVSESIVDSLRETEWSDEEIAEIRNIVKPNIIANTRLKKELLLLVANATSDIDEVETSIKKYADVYIANDKSLFKDSINRTAFEKQANSQIYTISGGKIVKDEGGGNVNNKKDRKAMPKFTTKPNPKENDKDVEGSTENEFEQSDGKTDTPSGDKIDGRKIPSKLIAAAAIAIIIAVAWFVFPKLVNKPADRIKLVTVPESGNTTDGLVITPKFYCGESDKTSTKLEDVVWTVEGNGNQFVMIPPLVNGKNLYLRLSDEYYKTKHPEAQIILYGSVKGNDLKMEGNSITIPAFEGRPATHCELLEHKDAIVNKFPDNKDIINFLAYREGTVYNKEVVSTTKDEISFSVTPSGYAEIKMDSDGNWKLFVKNDRPKSDSNIEVTVIASLKNTEIGNQKYTIVAKKETTNTPSSSVDVSGEIAYAKRTDFRSPNDANNAKDEHYIVSSSFSIREGLTNYYFIARDKNGNKLLGTWKCSGINISDTKKGENPLNFASTPGPDTYTLEYWDGKQKRASITITITPQ